MLAHLHLQHGCRGGEPRARTRPLLGQHDAALGVHLVRLDQHVAHQLTHHIETKRQRFRIVARQVDDEGRGVRSRRGVHVRRHLQADAFQRPLHFPVRVSGRAPESEVFKEVRHTLLARPLLHRARIDQQSQRHLSRRRLVRQDHVAHAVRQFAEHIVIVVRQVAPVTRPSRPGGRGLRHGHGLGECPAGHCADADQPSRKAHGDTLETFHHSSGRSATHPRGNPAASRS